MAKIRVHELAKELDMASKEILLFLQEAGIRVRSASSTLDSAAVSIVREKAAAGLPAKKRHDEAAQAAYRKAESILRAKISELEASPEYAAGNSWMIEQVEARRVWLSNLRASYSPPGATPTTEEAAYSVEDPSGMAVSIQAPPIAAEDYSPAPAISDVVDEPATEEAASSVEGPSEMAVSIEASPIAAEDSSPVPASSDVVDEPATLVSFDVPAQGYVEYQRGTTGVSYEKLIVPYLLGATEIVITDPYIRTLHQARNLMELLEALLRVQDRSIQTVVHLRTSKDRDGGDQKDQAQKGYLDRLVSSVKDTNISLKYDLESGLHGRTIVANSGWRISLDRGLDIFASTPSDPLHLANRMQEFRKVRAFYVTYHQLT
jgi:hypothetical protein